MNKKTSLQRLCSGAVIAAFYTVLTYLSSALGLAYGAIQFRLSEALCVLPLFSGWSVVGLSVGCILGNLASPFGFWDILFGTAATLSAGILTNKCKNLNLKGIPILSLMFPVLFNALLVGLEVAFLVDGEFLPLFSITFLEVFIGEGAVIFALGLPLYLFCKKSKHLGKFLK
ncbi:MAG: QueT transporter family protein [Clostridia bacterium]|nr:QueT transporter family protein [Clostridia bacterium]